MPRPQLEARVLRVCGAAFLVGSLAAHGDVAAATLEFSTYLGGTGVEGRIAKQSVSGIGVDAAGNVYVASTTSSLDFPTAGPFQPTYAGANDAFVAKLDPAGSTLLYCTYLGGVRGDSGEGLAVDPTGHAYVVGQTGSFDFPTVNPIQPLRGTADVFVTKLAPDGASLVYSTYLGGEEIEYYPAIAIDATGAALVTGSTMSHQFPTVNPFQPSRASNLDLNDAFVAKLDPSGSAILYASYLGGSLDEGEGHAIAVDSVGNAFVLGTTRSPDFPTVLPLQGSNAGLGDLFVAKVGPGGALLRSTFLGGLNIDEGQGLCLDASGSPYLVGWTASADFPTLNPFQPQLRGTYDAYLTKLDPDLSRIVYSTYLGGDGSDGALAVAVDARGSAYVTGHTGDMTFPAVCPFPANVPGAYDVFLAKFDPAGSSLAYSVHLGGADGDYGQAVAVTPSGDAFVAGLTNSGDFLTARPLQALYAGNADEFIAKVVECGQLPGRIVRLKGVKRLPADAWFGWDPDPFVCPGYRMYAVDAKRLIPTANAGGSPVCTTTTGMTECRLGALLVPPTLVYYQVTGLCTNAFEGPL